MCWKYFYSIGYTNQTILTNLLKLQYKKLNELNGKAASSVFKICARFVTVAYYFLRPVHLPMHTKSNILLWKKVFAVSSFDTLKTKNIDGRWLVFVNVFNRPGQNLIAIVELCIVVIHIVRYTCSRDNTVSTVHRQPKIQRFKKRERKSFNNSGDVF